jgi:hypothetical protein
MAQASKKGIKQTFLNVIAFIELLDVSKHNIFILQVKFMYISYFCSGLFIQSLEEKLATKPRVFCY